MTTTTGTMKVAFERTVRSYRTTNEGRFALSGPIPAYTDTFVIDLDYSTAELVPFVVEHSLYSFFNEDQMGIVVLDTEEGFVVMSHRGEVASGRMVAYWRNVPLPVVPCPKCHDEGAYPTGWSDVGGPADGPLLEVTDWSYCDCQRGREESDKDGEEYRMLVSAGIIPGDVERTCLLCGKSSELHDDGECPPTIPETGAAFETLGFPDFVFRTLSPEEEEQFRQAAREVYVSGEDISPAWHPVYRDECRLINEYDAEKLLSATIYS